MSRGYHRMTIFLDSEDFNHFLDDLAETNKSHRILIHAYCLMNNHFHLFSETPLANLQESMQRLLSRYAAYFKNKYKHNGKVFEKRYKAILVDSNSYAIQLTKYIHLNPVGIQVKDPESWIYSSFRQYLGFDLEKSFLQTSMLLSLLDSDKSDNARKKLWIHHKEEDSAWEPEEFLYAQSILGSEDFIDSIQKYLPEKLNCEIRGLRHLKSKHLSNLILDIVYSSQFSEETKKNLSIYLLRKITSLKHKEINNLLNEDFKTYTISRRLNRLKREIDRSKEFAKNVYEIECKVQDAAPINDRQSTTSKPST
jgi:putative transposase